MIKIWFVAAFAATAVLAAVMLRATTQKTSPPRVSSASHSPRKDTAVKTEIATFGGG
jgi:hypothetical protein